jgi:hypothetical protein
VSYPTVAGIAVEGVPYREAQVCLTPAFASSYYLFFLSGTSTPTNVYTNGALTVPFSTGNRVNSDAFGRFLPIYLDPSIIYRVQLFNSANVLQRQTDPYVSQLSTVGTSSLSPYGFQIAPTGEFTLDAPNVGGSGVTLTLKAGVLGSAALRVTGTLPGNSAIIVNSSATTGTQTATFAAANKPGTATSSPAGWLPVTCDNVQYYTPIWHGNNFTPYTPNPSAVGEVIVADSVSFGGNGLTQAFGGTAVPSNWFSPATAGIGAGYYINITKTGGLSGSVFAVATNINATVAPAGVYTGGTLTSNFLGNTASNYVLVLSTGQTIAGATFTNGSPTFTVPSTVVTGTPNVVLQVSVQGVWANITSGGIVISSNAFAGVTGTYQISSSPSGSPIVAQGTILLELNVGVQSPPWNGSTPIVLAGNGTSTLKGASAAAWYTPTTAGVGADYYLLITQAGGTPGYTFSAATGTPANITSGGLTVGVSGSGATAASVTGVYTISSDAAGLNVLGTNTITLSSSNVQSQNWSSTQPLFLAGNGATLLDHSLSSSWYSPNAANVGSGFWINITRTGGTTGVNFSAAQGSWTNITNSGLTIGTTGAIGTTNVSGTYQISSSSTGTPVLGSGTLFLTS